MKTLIAALLLLAVGLFALDVAMDRVMAWASARADAQFAQIDQMGLAAQMARRQGVDLVALTADEQYQQPGGVATLREALQ